MKPNVQIKRVYDAVQDDDGYRVLIDRLWPRGIAKVDLVHDQWCKELGPSTELRKWFAHDVDRWPQFCDRYRQELQTPEQQQRIQDLLKAAKGHRVTLLYSAKDEEHNQAVVLASEIK